MSQIIPFNGSNYTIPDVNDTDWGQNVTDFLVALPNGILQPQGGLFSLTADVDFGANFGLESIYYKSRTADEATVGVLRLAHADQVVWRNNANSANLLLGVNALDQLTFNGIVIESDTLASAEMFVGNASNESTGRAMSGAWTVDNLGVSTISNDYITDIMINSAAAIDYTKLDIAAGEIAYAKLTLTDSVVNADINSAAAIAFTKMAAFGSLQQVLATDASGFVVESSWALVVDDMTTAAEGELRFTDNSTNHVALKSPASVTTYDFIFPGAVGANGEVLAVQDFTTGQLAWQAMAGAGTINSGLTGFVTYYPANGIVVDDQTLLALTNITAANPRIELRGVSAQGEGRGQLLDFYGVTTDPSTQTVLAQIGGFKSTNADTNLRGELQFFTADVAGVSQLAFELSSNQQGLFPVGTAALPSVGTVGDTNTGMYGNGSDRIGFSANALETFVINTSGVTLKLGQVTVPDGTTSLPGYAFENNTAIGMYRGTNTLGLATVTSGDIEFRINSVQIVDIQAGNIFLGNAGQTTQLLAGYDGTAVDPAWSFASQVGMGIYRAGTNILGFATAGVAAYTISATGRSNFVPGTLLLPGITQAGDTDTGLFHQAVDNFVAVAGGVAQATFYTGGLALKNGLAGSPSLNFATDTDSGMTRLNATDELTLIKDGTRVFDWNASRIVAQVPIQFPSGTIAAPSITFNVDPNTGFAWNQDGNFNVSCNDTRTFNFTPTVTVAVVEFRPDADDALNCGTAAKRWADVRSVLINGADIGFENGWRMREYPCTEEDIHTKSIDWMKENAHLGIQVINRDKAVVARFEHDGIFHAKGFKSFDGFDFRKKIETNEEKIVKLENEIKVLKEAA